MTTTSTALRHRAAIVAWALRRVGLVRSWRQCVTAGLCVAAASGTPDVVEVADVLVRLMRAGELNLACGFSAHEAALSIQHALSEARRYERALKSARIGVSERALLDATRGASRPSWEALARMSLVRPRRGEFPVYLDRRDYAAQVERFVAANALRPSAIGPLMGWDGEL